MNLVNLNINPIFTNLFGLPSISNNIPISNIVEFPSIPELLGDHYIGYQIEKERFDINTKTWISFGTENIIGRLNNEYFDALVAYNKVYRYRIYSVLKHTFSGSSLVSNVQSNQLGVLPGANAINNNSLNNEENIRSIYLKSNPSRWYYIVTKEQEPPPPPSDFNIWPCTPKKQFLLTWSEAENKQRDTKFFFILRRESIESPWVIIAAELNKYQTYWVDDKIEVGKKYIYAVQTEDAHGFRSRLSMQLLAELNDEFNCDKKEKPIKFISEPGTVPELPHIVLNKKTLDPFEEIIIYKNIKIIPNLNFSEDEKNFIIKVTSLDTGKFKNIKLIVKNTIENS